MNIIILDDDISANRYLVENKLVKIVANVMVFRFSHDFETGIDIKTVYQALFLDHHLDGSEKNGLQIAEWIVANKVKIKKIFLNSNNYLRAKEAYDLLTKNGYEVMFLAKLNYTDYTSDEFKTMIED